MTQSEPIVKYSVLSKVVRRAKSWSLLLPLFILFSTSFRGSAGQVLHGQTPPAVAGLPSIGRLPSEQRLNLAISLPLRDRDGLASFLKQLYDPSSPAYHQYVDPAEFTEKFGPAETDYQSLIAFAQTNNLGVTVLHPNRVLLDVNARVADIEKAFHVTLRLYQHPTEARTFFAPDRDPSLDLTTPVLGINGLDNFWLPHPCLKPAPAVARPNSGSGPSGEYMGGDFRAAYLPGVTLNGSGQRVGLLQFDGYFASDIASYEAQAGLPNVSLQNVLLDGFSGTPGNNNAEVSLDIEMSISMAPGLAQVIVYEAGASGVPNDILNRMATDNLAKQLSSSWTWSPFDITADQIFQQMAAQGQSFFEASGDGDAYVGSVAKPSDDPYVIVVGGTTLTTTGPAGSWVSETAWNWGRIKGSFVGSGGGVSTDYTIPTWQQGIDMSANQGSTTMRNLPDVALTADNVYVVYNNGGSGSFGGTSCATPLWAGLTALINQQAAANHLPPVGFLNPALYSIGKGSGYSAAFHDITTGNNITRTSPTKYVAVTGYDLCTGWGTPVGSGLIAALTGAAAPTAPAISSGPTNRTVVIGSNATFQVTASGTAPLSYQWRHDGTNLLGATANPLALTGVQISQAGSYAVVVTNVAGAVTSSTALLRILVPPLIGSSSITGNQFSLSITGLQGLIYTLEYKDSFTNSVWTTLPPSLTGNGGPLILQDTNGPGPARFYRVRCE